MNTARLKYFDGTSDNLEALEAQVREWIEPQGPAVHLNSAAHFDVEEKVWRILVTALYQKQQRPSGLVIPRAHIPGNPMMN